MNIFVNCLTGTIPSSFNKLKSLHYFQGSSNCLGGSLSNVFDPYNQFLLHSIQLNNNQLTGTIPSEIFLLPRLVNFDVVNNCLSGEIPFATICKSQSLINLIMDGLHANPFCRQLVFPDSSLLSSSFTLKSNLFNRLDPCIFTMMNSLQTLHLSGNGLTGSLPDDSKISNNLTDVSLSHNLLTGSIPDSFQSKRWKRLDLSFNRISGTLSSSGFDQLNANSAVYLEENWLSGNIPNGLVGAQQINILNGNIFSCSLSKSDAPRYDPDFPNYNCGSNSFDVVYFTWMGLVGSISIILLIWKYMHLRDRYHWKDSMIRIIQLLKGILTITCSPTISDSIGVNVEKMKNKLNILLRLSFFLMIFIITVMLTIYTIDGSLYSLYSYQYGWRVSIAFQSGAVSYGLSFSALFVLMWMFLYLLSMQMVVRSKTEVGVDVSLNLEASGGNKSIDTPISLNWVVTPLINVFVVGGVNFLNVYLYLHQSSVVIIVLQILLAMFKSF